MKGILRILGGAKEKGVVDLETGTYQIGRDEGAQIRIDSRQVSRKHAQIIVDRHHVRLVDAGSANGTLVNGKPFTAGPLYEGDRIQVGEVVFEFHVKRNTLAAQSSTERDALTVRRTKTVSKVGGKKATGLPLRILLSAVLTVTCTGLALVSGLSYRSMLHNRLQREALRHGAQLVRYLAEKNREDLKLGNELLLDVDTTAREKGVRDAAIINRKGRVLAPVSRLSRLENDPFTTEALAQIGDRPIAPSPPLTDGSLIFVHPIRAYSDKSGGYETLGAAKIVFSPADYAGSLPEANRLILAMVLFAAMLALTISWILAKALNQPLQSLAESLHLWRTARQVDFKNPPFAEWAGLYDAIEQTVEEKNR